MAGDYLVVGVDHRNFDQVEFLEALFEILDLLRAHDPRVLVVRDEVGDFARLRAPCEFGHIKKAYKQVKKLVLRLNRPISRYTSPRRFFVLAIIVRMLVMVSSGYLRCNFMYIVVSVPLLTPCRFAGLESRSSL